MHSNNINIILILYNAWCLYACLNQHKQEKLLSKILKLIKLIYTEVLDQCFVLLHLFYASLIFKANYVLSSCIARLFFFFRVGLHTLNLTNKQTLSELHVSWLFINSWPFYVERRTTNMSKLSA